MTILSAVFPLIIAAFSEIHNEISIAIFTSASLIRGATVIWKTTKFKTGIKQNETFLILHT